MTINKEQIKAAIKEVRDCGEKIKPVFQGTNLASVEEALRLNLIHLLHKKLDEEIQKSFGFYSLEDLIETIKVLDGKSEEKPSVVPERGTGEVQPGPALDSPKKPSVRKTSKGTVLKRV